MGVLNLCNYDKNDVIDIWHSNQRKYMRYIVPIER